MEGELAEEGYENRDRQLVPNIWTESHHNLWEGPLWHMAQDRLDQNSCTSPTPPADGIS